MKDSHKTMMRLSIVAVLDLFGVIIATGSPATFHGIGFLPGGSSSASSAQAASADGKVVVGYSSSSNGLEEAVLWTNGVLVGLGDLPAGGFDSFANSVSADGSVIVGAGTTSQGYEAFRWEAGVMTGLGVLPGYRLSVASAVSRDGLFIIGGVDNEFQVGSLPQAFRWKTGTMTGLGDLPGGEFDSYAQAITTDGLIIVGRGWTDVSQHYEAFIWRDGSMNGLGFLTGGRNYSQALAVTPDGVTIVGVSSSARSSQLFDHGEACRWDNGVISALGDLPGGEFDSSAIAVSDDGQIIVGEATTDQGSAAFIWDPTNGMRSLQELAANLCGLDLSGWSLTLPLGISADGRTIVGRGLHNGSSEGWVLTIPRVIVINGERPVLTIQKGITLTWPACPMGYRLQATESLSAKDWRDIDVPVNTVNGTNLASITATGTQKFFRLAR